jgi:hypothetical protein
MLTASCVGTVEDSKLKMNDLYDQGTLTLPFEGLTLARPVSHNKIELEFNLANISDPNTKYFLYTNDGVNPIQISPESVDKAPFGRGRYMVDNLNINTSYKFRMRIRNTVTKAESKKEREVTAKTFDNRTANFKGVTSVSKVNGQSDTTIKVDWLSATMEGSVSAGSYDPYYYEVLVIGPGGPQNINNPSYILSDKKLPKRVPEAPQNLDPFNYTRFTSTVINGLLPSTQYYVQVRAINRLYDINDGWFKDGTISSINVNKEVNTKFLSITTDPANGTFDFTPDSFLARSAPSDAYKFRIDSNWFSASGTYVGYKLFYIPCISVNCTASSTVDEAQTIDLLDDATIDKIKVGPVPLGAGYSRMMCLIQLKRVISFPA